MRIVIDMQGAQAENCFRGIGRYTMALSKVIARNFKAHEIILVLNGAFPDSIQTIRTSFADILHSDNIKVWYPITPAAYVGPDNKAKRQASECVYEAFLTSLVPDVVILSSLFEGLVDNAVTLISNKGNSFLTAVILYDLIPFINPSPYLENPVVKDWYLKKIDHLKNANLCFAISESSRQEGIDQLGLLQTNCINISTDADKQFRILEQSSTDLELIKQKYAIKNDFIMYTGGIDFRKNIEGLIRAYSLLPKKLREQYQLAIVCSVQESVRTKLHDIAKQQGLIDGELTLTGFVPEKDLVNLYNSCSLFVFPSLHEGFGLPALEAMRCGAPVIASNLSSLIEVVGMDEALFDPNSDEELANLMKRALTNEVFRQHLKENARQQSKKFSWNETAERVIEAIEKAHLEKNQLASKEMPRLKLAYVSPLPPEHSGISDYSAELLPVLAKHYQIEIIVEQDIISNEWIKKHCPVRSVEWFVQNAHSYDRVLYHFGNSPFHEHMFGMLNSVPGVVVLHDFYLSGIVHHMQAKGYAPGFFNSSLYHSHGYTAVRDMAETADIEDLVWKYPISRGVLEKSVGTIVHSENSVRLAEKWYEFDRSFIKVVPLMRLPAVELDLGIIRKSLGFDESDFIVCSFGLIGPHKLNDRLLKAWLSSALAKDKNCHFVFVGENNLGKYGDELLSIIQNSPCANRIHITGWASMEKFKKYLSLANIAVQLRTLSRGETSAAVLDCMNHGIPTIVNANGSMADLDPNAIWLLPDVFDDADLIQALETLWRDPEKRKTIGENARNLILYKHNPDKCAQDYAKAIEDFYRTNPPACFQLIPKLASIIESSVDDGDLQKLAINMTLSFPLKNTVKQVLVDISELVQRDSKSGIQRVVRSILKSWLENPPEGVRIEPIYATKEQGYRYARCFTSNFMNWPCDDLADEPIDYVPGDIFIGLDLNHSVVLAQSRFLKNIHQYGVDVRFVVYDLLPIQFPEFWESSHLLNLAHEEWLSIITNFSGAICISKAVSEDLNAWLAKNKPDRLKIYKMGWFHLGADIENSQLSLGLPLDAQAILSQLGASVTFLMVGTLEPRKGHTQVLDSFELLWQDDANVNLVVVGKQGWLVNELVRRLRSHPELNKRLFWLEGISDEYLEKVYAASTALIAASFGEGFGLPLIEAAQHKLPIIARDIPVFREVAGEYAYYFKTDQPFQLARTIKSWISLNEKNQHPKSDGIPWLTWKQSSIKLLEAIFNSQSIHINKE